MYSHSNVHCMHLWCTCTVSVLDWQRAGSALGSALAMCCHGTSWVPRVRASARESLQRIHNHSLDLGGRRGPRFPWCAAHWPRRRMRAASGGSGREISHGPDCRFRAVPEIGFTAKNSEVRATPASAQRNRRSPIGHSPTPCRRVLDDLERHALLQEDAALVPGDRRPTLGIVVESLYLGPDIPGRGKQRRGISESVLLCDERQSERRPSNATLALNGCLSGASSSARATLELPPPPAICAWVTSGSESPSRRTAPLDAVLHLGSWPPGIFALRHPDIELVQHTVFVGHVLTKSRFKAAANIARPASRRPRTLREEFAMPRDRVKTELVESLRLRGCPSLNRHRRRHTPSGARTLPPQKGRATESSFTHAAPLAPADH